MLGLLEKLWPFSKLILSAPVNPGNLFKVLPEFKEELTLEDVFFRDNRPLLPCDPWDVGLPPDPFKLL